MVSGQSAAERPGGCSEPFQIPVMQDNDDVVPWQDESSSKEQKTATLLVLEFIVDQLSDLVAQ